MHVLSTTTTTALALSLLVGSSTATSAAQPGAQISYTSQPDRLAVFLNNIAFAHDTVSLPGGVDVRLTLPDTVLPDTLILRENGRRVPDYRLDRQAGPLAISWQSASDSDVREVTLDYLVGGVAWRPTYDMWIGADADTTVDLDFMAEITDGGLHLDDVETQLVAGLVDLTAPISPEAEFGASERANLDDLGYAVSARSGQMDIQHIYDVGTISAAPGDTVYTQLVGETLPAQRLHVWSASTDDQVTVIYKVTNESDQPLAEGVVRSYQNELFIGSDFIELTPIGSEGSVSVGHLQDVRVKREESRTAIAEGRFDYRDEVSLTISNFTPRTVHLEVVDHQRPEAEQLVFSMQPAQDAGNLLRWQVSVEPGDELVIGYEYLVD